jgi:RNA polymerase sigma-70 factor (ECF subfamily)
MADSPHALQLADGDLIRLAGEGDRNAFDQLYRRFARPVFGLALRRLGSPDRAEDATQETFTSIWRAAATYRPERGPGKPWLYAIARNAIVNQTRIRSEPPAEILDSAADEPGPLERAESAWLSRRVHRAVEELPEHQRTLIRLAYWGQLSQSEIATQLGIPIGTIKTRTRAALARLAELLDREDLDEPENSQLEMVHEFRPTHH